MDSMRFSISGVSFPCMPAIIFCIRARIWKSCDTNWLTWWQKKVQLAPWGFMVYILDHIGWNSDGMTIEPVVLSSQSP
jgi:hypothetical protein